MTDLKPEELKRLLDAATNDVGVLTTNGCANIGHYVYQNAPAILALVEENARLENFAQTVLCLGDTFMQPDTIREMASQALAARGYKIERIEQWPPQN